MEPAFDNCDNLFRVDTSSRIVSAYVRIAGDCLFRSGVAVLLSQGLLFRVCSLWWRIGMSSTLLNMGKWLPRSSSSDLHYGYLVDWRLIGGRRLSGPD